MAENGILDYQGMNQAIYRGATSNIIVDTQSMSIEIGAGNSSHTSNLHIECDHAANVASIQLNSNVVTEFSRSKKLIKYPRVAMTGQTTSNHTITGSSWYGSSALGGSGTEYFPWKAFDNVGNHPSGQLAWYSFDYSAPEAYSGTDDAFNPSHGGTATPVLFTGAVQGEWLKIQLPHKVALDHYIMYGPNQEREFPRDWTVYGSVDGTNWNWIDSRVSQTFGDGTGSTGTATGKKKEFQFDTPTNEYLYFAFVFTRASVDRDIYIGIGEIELYGTPEYDPEAHGTDVTVKSYPNVPNTDWLEVYYDAKDLTSISGTIADLSGKSVTGSLNGDVSIDTLNDVKSFSFDGSGDYIKGNLTNTGDFDFTVSLWLKKNTSGTVGMLWNLGGSGGSGNPEDSVALEVGADDRLGYFIFSGAEGAISNFGVDYLNKWVHIVATRTGIDLKIYLDGVDQNLSVSGTDTLQLAANTEFTIGARGTGALGNNPLNGSIANFRIFNRVLTTDEIYQLYAYQKEYFGHGDLSMTLKAGRLGIGTSEPRAALDVRGMLNISDKIESPFFKVFSIFDKMNPTVNNSHWSRSIEGTIYAGSSVIVVANVGGFRDTQGGGNTWNIQYKIAGTTTWITLSDIYAFFNQTGTHMYRTRTFVWKPTEDIHFIEWRITTTLNCNADDKVDLVLVSLPV